MMPTIFRESILEGWLDCLGIRTLYFFMPFFGLEFVPLSQEYGWTACTRATSHLLFRQLWWLCGSGWALASGCRVSSPGYSHQQCRADSATSCGSLQSASARGEGHFARELSHSDLKLFQAFHDTIMVDSQSVQLNAVPSCSKWKWLVADLVPIWILSKSWDLTHSSKHCSDFLKLGVKLKRYIKSHRRSIVMGPKSFAGFSILNFTILRVPDFWEDTFCQQI